MSINFVSITPAVIAAADKKPGHSDLLYWCLQGDFDAWAPTLSDGTPGATKRIVTDHTWLTNKGVHTIQAKPKSVDGTADSAGEVGGAIITYKYKFLIKGDSPTINEFFENVLNEDIVVFFNDPTCGQTNYIQLGSECTPANISAPSYRSGSKGAGGFKEYEMTVECTDKFFYEGALVDANENTQLATPILSVGGIGATGATIDWTAVTNAVTYEIEYGTSSTFVSPTATTTTAPTSLLAITGLVTATQYYARVRAVATGYVTGEWATIAFLTD